MRMGAGVSVLHVGGEQVHAGSAAARRAWIAAHHPTPLVRMARSAAARVCMPCGSLLGCKASGCRGASTLQPAACTMPSHTATGAPVLIVGAPPASALLAATHPAISMTDRSQSTSRGRA